MSMWLTIKIALLALLRNKMRTLLTMLGIIIGVAAVITMLSIGVTAAGQFKFVVAEGRSVDGPIPPTGNTNTRGYFEPDVRTFLKRWVAEGPTHHFALGTGHHANELVEIARILDLDHVVVSP